MLPDAAQYEQVQFKFSYIFSLDPPPIDAKLIIKIFFSSFLIRFRWVTIS